MQWKINLHQDVELSKDVFRKTKHALASIIYKCFIQIYCWFYLLKLINFYYLINFKLKGNNQGFDKYLRKEKEKKNYRVIIKVHIYYIHYQIQE